MHSPSSTVTLHSVQLHHQQSQGAMQVQVLQNMHKQIEKQIAAVQQQQQQPAESGNAGSAPI